MSSKAGRLITILLLGLIVFFLGYFRNYVFVLINGQSSTVYYHEPKGPDLPGFLQFIASKDYTYLIRLKWVLTLLFTLVFFAVSMLMMKTFYKKGVYLKICGVLYGFLLLAACLVMLVGILIHPFSYHAFNIARNIMHISQSPFTVLFLFAVAYLYRQTGETLN